MGLTIGLGMAAAPERLALKDGGSLSAEPGRNGGVLLRVHDRPDLASELKLDLDETVAADSQPALRLLGEAARGIIILEDSYYSHPRGLSYCRAGREEFLRVLNLNRPAKETLRLKLNSCLQNRELTGPGVVWNPQHRTLEVHWLRDQVRYHLKTDGSPDN